MVSDPNRLIYLNGLNQLRVICSDWLSANQLLDSTELLTKECRSFIPASLISRKALAFDIETEFSPLSLSQKLDPISLASIISIRRRTEMNGSLSEKVEFTFSGVSIPETIQISRTVFDLTMLIAPPKRCYKCQRYRHFSKQCESRFLRCEFCAEYHFSRKCTNANRKPLCANCGGDHIASSKDCVFAQFEFQVMKTRSENNLSYEEADLQLASEGILRPTSTTTWVMTQEDSNSPLPSSSLSGESLASKVDENIQMEE